jgi:hypothetical protein
MIKRNDTDNKMTGMSPGDAHADPLVERLDQERRRLDEECSAVMASIDWEENARTITRQIPFKKTRQSWFAFSMKDAAITFNWKLAMPLVTGIFLMGIWLGYLLFHQPPRPIPSTQLMAREDTASGLPLERLEQTLARQEVAGYFKQSQLVLADLMQHCEADGSFSIDNRVDKQRVRALLSKNRYFKDNLDDPRLSASKPLLKKIEWLLYELLMTGDDSSCQKLERLQEYIKKERLLFKIRLIGEELSLSEV